MIDQRLTSLETKVDDLASGQAELRTDVSGLRTDASGLRTDVDSLRTAVTDLRTEMHTGFVEVRGEIADLKHHMLVLHEETLDTIKSLAPDLEPIRREFRAADEALREDIDRRLEPLEHAVRQQAQKRRRR